MYSCVSDKTEFDCRVRKKCAGTGAKRKVTDAKLINYKA